MARTGTARISRNFQVIVVVVAPILLLAPFLTKAFHIDDTFHLWVAQHLREHPFDFYGFSANRGGCERPMWDINKNPPLVSYYILLAALFLGWSEPGLHLAFLLPAVALSVGMYFLARRFCSRPCWAALAGVLTPAFLVSSSSVMTDTTMVAFYVWAAVFWIKGLEENRWPCLLAGAVLVAASALTKYFGMTMTPLLLAYTLATKRRFHHGIWFLLIPVGVLLAYQGLTYALYGSAHVSEAIRFVATTTPGGWRQFAERGISALSFTGGSFASVALLAPVLWPRCVWIAGALLTALVAAGLAAIGSVRDFELWEDGGLRWGPLIQLSLFVVAGIHILLLAVMDLQRHRNAASLLLFLWITGALAFPGGVNWMRSVRYLFPMGPAAAILAMRRLEFRNKEGHRASAYALAIPLILAGVLAFGVAWADASWANSQRTAAYHLSQTLRGRPGALWFQGHWGFQYYMETLGANPMDYENPRVEPGELLITPENNCIDVRLPLNAIRPVGRIEVPLFPWLRTMNQDTGAGFYADIFGPMPFCICGGRPDGFQVWVFAPPETTGPPNFLEGVPLQQSGPERELLDG